MSVEAATVIQLNGHFSSLIARMRVSYMYVVWATEWAGVLVCSLKTVVVQAGIVCAKFRLHMCIKPVSIPYI